MTATHIDSGSAPVATGTDLVRTARTTGLLYLAFFITGIAGSILVRAQLYADGDPQNTLSNLTQHEGLARLGIALELGIVVTQALTAVWFYRLFRRVDAFAAGSLALFGMVNAVAILASGALLATAAEVATDASLVVEGGAAPTVQLLYVASGHLWGVAAVFFGLWLIPMGWLVLRSGWMPRSLGWLLIGGGVCYFASAFVDYLLPSSDTFVGLLTVPATIGELWIMGYLITIGVRLHTSTQEGAVRAT
jgi:hypothetical protein